MWWSKTLRAGPRAPRPRRRRAPRRNSRPDAVSCLPVASHRPESRRQAPWHRAATHGRAPARRPHPRVRARGATPTWAARRRAPARLAERDISVDIPVCSRRGRRGRQLQRLPRLTKAISGDFFNRKAVKYTVRQLNYTIGRETGPLWCSVSAPGRASTLCCEARTTQKIWNRNRPLRCSFALGGAGQRQETDTCSRCRVKSVGRYHNDQQLAPSYTTVGRILKHFTPNTGT